MRPPGASSESRVSGSCIGRTPVSSSTVATHRLFEPDIGGVSSGSMMMNPICASGCFGGTRRFTWRNTPPRGSFSTKRRSRPSPAMNRDCSHSVSPGGGATPPTMTSPTSPSAWALTTWMTLLVLHPAVCLSLRVPWRCNDAWSRRTPRLRLVAVPSRPGAPLPRQPLGQRVAQRADVFQLHPAASADRSARPRRPSAGRAPANSSESQLRLDRIRRGARRHSPPARPLDRCRSGRSSAP